MFPVEHISLIGCVLIPEDEDEGKNFLYSLPDVTKLLKLSSMCAENGIYSDIVT